jgi:glycine/D-amino acid oxidase-like deaminating enzyme
MRLSHMPAPRTAGLRFGSAQHVSSASRDLGVPVDVAVIGADVAGLTAAMHLQRAGLDVAVVDALRVAGGASAFTRAHLATESGEQPSEIAALDAGRAVVALAELPPSSDLLLAERAPRAYALGLARHLGAAGVSIHERVVSVHLDETTRHQVTTERGVLRAAHVVFATAGSEHALAVSSRSYVVAFETREPVPAGLFWDADSPHLYVRTQAAGETTLILVGGEDRDSDPELDPSDRHERLAEWARARFGIESLHFMWSSQLVVPNDGRPYIGPSPHAPSTYVATGYAGDAPTLGALAARLVGDAVLAHGRQQPH